MRQGEVASKGKWQGRAQGGVSAPRPLILPDPGQRFADTAARLDALASGHPMQDWLRFMSRVAQGQHMAANTLAPGARPPLPQSRKRLPRGCLRSRPIAIGEIRAGATR